MRRQRFELELLFYSKSHTHRQWPSELDSKSSDAGIFLSIDRHQLMYAARAVTGTRN